jgi:hypothetical protein
MPRWLAPCFAVFVVVALALVACGPDHMAEFWRPISDPNIQLPLDRAQKKLDFDIGQCRCGIFPTNVSQPDSIFYQPDKERLTETGVSVTPNEKGDCVQRPSLVVAECMRARGWEVTNCSGRMPVAGGGALCAGYMLDDDKNK